MDILKLSISIAVCEMAGIIGSLFTIRKIPTWYASLKKPSFRPPNRLFGPVWTLLYLLMGISAYLIWQEGLESLVVKEALVVFLMQLALNVVWSIAFFGFESPFGGLIVIALLWGAILLSIIEFIRLSLTAGLLLIPYIVWVSFAAVLNAAIYVLNRVKED